MAYRFYLDASALVKRYVAEAGTPLVNHLFQQTAPDRLLCLHLGTVEVISIFVRRRNAQRITAAAFQQALTDFRAEVLDVAAFTKLPAPTPCVDAAMALVERYSVNATDGVILRSALDLADSLRLTGDDVVLVASDQRLLTAAQAEGLVTFNPETGDQARLTTLIGS